TVSKNNYKGQVTVINFWATWCRPCVEEIPSLNRLKQKMAGLPFELISINYAEDKKTILEFMRMVKVEFPVLLDQEGNFAKQWNVIAYPSTFVIDKNGKIQYGVNAAIEWDDPELIKQLKTLL
ncbi:MAG: TlpA family protein disulfide reductase, partial [Gammaproteobacteria bacterium]|nr:TlpA family protein disulfide reductase [Gammaproteobacteria bacterium]